MSDIHSISLLKENRFSSCSSYSFSSQQKLATRVLPLPNPLQPFSSYQHDVTACELGRCATLALLRWYKPSPTQHGILQLQSQCSVYAIRLNIYGINLKPVSSPMYGRGNLKTISTRDAEFPYGKCSHRHFGIS